MIRMIWTVRTMARSGMAYVRPRKGPGKHQYAKTAFNEKPFMRFSFCMKCGTYGLNQRSQEKGPSIRSNFQ